MMRRSRRGLGGIIAMIIIVMLVTILALHFLFMRRVNQSYSVINQIENTRQRLLQMSKTLVRAGLIGVSTSSNSYRFALINSMNYPIQIVGMVLTDTGGKSYILNSSSMPSIITNISTALYSFTGNELTLVRTYRSPVGVSVGSSYVLEVNITSSVPIDYSKSYFVFTIPFTAQGYGNLNQPSFVPITRIYSDLLSFAKGIIVASPSNISTTNVTTKSLIRACGDHTETWLGPLKFNVTIGQVLEAWPIDDIKALEKADGNYVSLTSRKLSVTTRYTLEIYENNTVYFNDFSRSLNLKTIGGDWEQGSTYGLYDGGVYQNSEGTGNSLYNSGEYVALYISPETISSKGFYLLTILKAGYGKKEGSLGLAINETSWLSSTLYDFSIAPREEELRCRYGYNILGIWTGWSIAKDTSLGTVSGWYEMILNITSLGYSIELYGFQSDNFSIVTTLDCDNNMYPLYYFTPGIATYRQKGYFDMFLISKSYPAIITFTSPLNMKGWKIEILNATGALVGYGYFNSLGVAEVNVLKEPIIWNWTIMLYDSDDNLREIIYYNETEVPVLIGGNVYELSKTTTTFYSSLLVDEINVSSKAQGLKVTFRFKANVSGSYEILASNNNSTWIKIYDGTYASPGEWITGTAPLGVTPNNDIVYLKIIFNSTEPFELDIDELNVIGYVPGGNYVLMVGCGGTNYIDIYNVTAGSNGPEITYWFTVTLPSNMKFDGYQDFSYDPITQKLIIARSSGNLYIYIGSLSESPQLSSYSLGIKTSYVKLEAFNGVAVVVANNTQANDVIVLKLYESNPGTIVFSTSIEGYSLDAYGTSALDAENLRVYFTLEGEASTPVFEYDISNNGLRILYNLSYLRLVGCTLYQNELWFAIEGGGFKYLVLGSTIKEGSYNPVMPAVPIGPGDRLEAYDGYLLLVRGDYTSDIFIIPMPSS